VNSFIFLARHGWYDNTPFTVVTSKFLVGGGLGETNGYPGYTSHLKTTRSPMPRPA